MAASQIQTREGRIGRANASTEPSSAVLPGQSRMDCQLADADDVDDDDDDDDDDVDDDDDEPTSLQNKNKKSSFGGFFADMVASRLGLENPTLGLVGSS